MSEFYDYSKLLDTNYSRQIFSVVDKYLATPNLIDGIRTSCETVPPVDERSYALKLTLVNFVDNSDVLLPILFTDNGFSFTVNILVYFRDNYDITRASAELITELNDTLSENGSITGFEKCSIMPEYTSPMHVRISRKFDKTTSFEEDAEKLRCMCIEMLSLPVSFYKTMEKRINTASQNCSPTSSSQSGGCYVATCVFGSYDCPQVWTLRRYRDYTLSETWYGRAFIKTYYAISPKLVKWFGETKWFKKMWASILNRMVEILKSKGFESTPYEDKNSNNITKH